ncbi:unnamed protein product [Rangifer tarandus platyrhynchus]|uniref:Uncharacterized protein n=1 Tax=Rangifer tarandus platyrhynchus TaxID=3082113 RepID=A0ABN8YYJ6_RANTA|nr:unnamed protein product [Rangifer tarandus platyrhynchus]
MVFRRSLINDISRFKIQGPNVSVNNSTISGPRRVETGAQPGGALKPRLKPPLLGLPFPLWLRQSLSHFCHRFSYHSCMVCIETTFFSQSHADPTLLKKNQV